MEVAPTSIKRIVDILRHDEIKSILLAIMDDVRRQVESREVVPGRNVVMVELPWIIIVSDESLKRIGDKTLQIIVHSAALREVMASYLAHGLYKVEAKFYHTDDEEMKYKCYMVIAYDCFLSQEDIDADKKFMLENIISSKSELEKFAKGNAQKEKDAAEVKLPGAPSTSK